MNTLFFRYSVRIIQRATVIRVHDRRFQIRVTPAVWAFTSVLASNDPKERPSATHALALVRLLQLWVKMTRWLYWALPYHSACVDTAWYRRHSSINSYPNAETASNYAVGISLTGLCTAAEQGVIRPRTYDGEFSHIMPSVRDKRLDEAISYRVK